MNPKRKVFAVAAFIGFVELLIACVFFAYRSVVTPGSLFQLSGGRGAQSLETIDHYLAVICFVGALVLLGVAKKTWISK